MKKKLLTLTFTLVLLIGLVVAMGMNAGAADVTCTANGNICTVSNGDDLRLEFARADDGDTIRLSQDIVFQNASGNFEIEPMYQSSKGGDVILDLNGYGLYVAAKNSYLFDLAEVQNVALHIVNSDPVYDGWIQFLPQQAGSSVFYLGSSNNKLYIYEGVSVTMGKASTAVTGSQATYIINASSYAEIGIHGAYLENLFISGEGLYFNNNSIGMRNSKVYIDGGAEIKTNSSCIDLHNSPYYPDFQIGAAILDGNNAVEVIDDNQYANTTETALKFKDLLQDGYNLYMVSGSSGDNMNNASLLYNNDTDDCHIYKGTYSGSCSEHANKKNVFAYTGGHLTQCTDCGYSTGITLHTQVSVKEATCTATGYSKAGYDCACGYKTAEVAPVKSHDFIEYAKTAATCTSNGWKNTMYKCKNCATYLDPNKNQISFKEFSENRIPALGHDMKAVDAVAATCTKDGNIAHYDCSRCDLITSDAEGKNAITTVVVKAKGHSYNAATCTTPKTCTVCKATTGTAKGHDYAAATCTAPATCKVCKATTGAAKGHTLTTLKAKAATYKSTGLTEGKKCSVCGKVTVAQKTVARKTLKKVTGLKTKAVKLASGTKTTLTLSWTKTTGAEKYEIQQYVSKQWKKIGTTENTSYTVKKLKSDKSYKFRVRAIAGSNKGSFSSSYTAKTVPLKPTLSLKAGSKQLTASWKTVANITGFEVQYSTSSKFTSKTTKKVTIKKSKATKTTIKKLKKGKKYYVKVRAYKTVGKTKIYSAWSSVKTVKVK